MSSAEVLGRGASPPRTPASPPRTPAVLGPVLALARRGLRDSRTRTIGFLYLFALYAYIQPVGYRSAYPTLTDRLGFVHSFAGNDAIRLFYGYPYDPLSVGGYCAWRVGGTLAIAAAVFGVLAAVRALRTEEEAGRSELVLAAPVGRTTALASALSAIGVGVVLLWAGAFVGFLLGGLPAGGAAYLALAIASVAPVFVGVGALTSQLAPTRRVALELGTATVGLSLLLRVIADTGGGVGWLRWATPLGWAEELRPFTGAQPLVLLLPAATSVGLCVLTARIAARRDVGTGMLPSHDTAAPRLRLLSSTSAQALRSERDSLGVWLGTVGVFSLVFGVVSKSVSTAGISEATQREIAKLGSGSIATPSGYVSFVFIFVILVVSLFACAQINVARHEEAEGRLETLLALPVSRGGWLAGRLVIAALGAASIALVAALLAWAGAASQGVAISLSSMLGAGANCLPVAFFFLGIAALAYALVPRACVGVAYGLVTVTFLWQLVGSLLAAPTWLVELTPFAHVGLVPAQPFKAADAAVMLGISLGACAVASWAFARRDLVGE